jgi:hypothetical protein
MTDSHWRYIQRKKAERYAVEEASKDVFFTDLSDGASQRMMKALQTAPPHCPAEAEAEMQKAFEKNYVGPEVQPALPPGHSDHDKWGGPAAEEDAEVPPSRETWEMQIATHIENGDFRAATDCMMKMEEAGFKPSAVVIKPVLKMYDESMREKYSEYLRKKYDEYLREKHPCWTTAERRKLTVFQVTNKENLTADALCELNLSALTVLKELDLSGCGSLTAVPDLSALTALEKLNLEGCKSLTAVPDLSALTALKELMLRGCGSLTALPDLSALEARGCRVYCA